MKQPDKLSILLITRKFPPSVGGMQRYAYDLYQALRPEATIHLVKWGGSNKYLPVVLPVFFVQCCWILATRQVDIIQAQDGLLAPLAGVLKFIFRKPVCIVTHGLDVTFPNALYQAVIPSAIGRTDHVFCISQATLAQNVAHGIPAAKMQIIPLGITDDLFRRDHAQARQQIIERAALQPDAAILLATGRLVKRKGVDWFVNQVMPQLVRHDPHIVLLVSGDGPERETIEASIAKHQLQQSVKLLGRTDDAFLRDLYNGSNIYVMPNISVPGDMEGFGRVLLEAALCELPIVASGIEGIRDAITNGKNGLLVAEQDAAAFVKNIQAFSDNPRKRSEFGTAARHFTLTSFNWPHIVAQFLDTYRQLVSSR